MVTNVGMIKVDVVGTPKCGGATETDVKEVLAIFNNSKNAKESTTQLYILESDLIISGATLSAPNYPPHMCTCITRRVYFLMITDRKYISLLNPSPCTLHQPLRFWYGCAPSTAHY